MTDSGLGLVIGGTGTASPTASPPGAGTRVLLVHQRVAKQEGLWRRRRQASRKQAVANAYWHPSRLIVNVSRSWDGWQERPAGQSAFWRQTTSEMRPAPVHSSTERQSVWP